MYSVLDIQKALKKHYPDFAILPKKPTKHGTLIEIPDLPQLGRSGSGHSDAGRGGGGDHSDPEIRGMPGLKEKFVPPFGPQFCLKIRGAAPSPRSVTG